MVEELLDLVTNHDSEQVFGRQLIALIVLGACVVGDSGCDAGGGVNAISVYTTTVTHVGHNRITRSSKFSFRYCKYEILYIGKAKHHISIDMALRYWQVISNKASHAKLAFFGINAKLTWTRISMGDHNAAPFFGAMTEVPQDFQEDSDKRHTLDCSLEVIMDEKMLFAVSL